MFRKIFPTALFVVFLMCLLPSVHAETGDLNVKTDILYTGENSGGSLLPHFLGSPGFGGKVSIAYQGDAVDFNTGFSSVHSYLQDKSGLNGHTGVAVGIGKEVGIAYLSARQSYMHTATDSEDFFMHDVYETVLKAELKTGAQSPYIFTGVVVPAYVPIQEIVGMAGFGLTTHIPVYSDAAWSTGIHSDTSIATSLLNISHEPETVMQARVALQTRTTDAPLVIDLGFNFFQDIRRMKYSMWWDVNVSYLF